MTGKRVRIENAHISRVEGHGSIVLHMDGERVDRVEWQIPEAPRFFESMVVGRDCLRMISIKEKSLALKVSGRTYYQFYVNS